MLWASSLLSALIGGVAATLLTHYLIERRESIRTARGLKYLALQIAFLLEHFAVECATSLQDAKNYEGSNGAVGKMMKKLPELSAFPQDGEYSVLDATLLTRILSFRLKVDSSNSSVLFEDTLNGDHAAHDACMAICLQMGLEASKLSDKVRETYRLVPFELERTLWDYRTYLKEQQAFRRTIKFVSGVQDAGSL